MGVDLIDENMLLTRILAVILTLILAFANLQIECFRIGSIFSKSFGKGLKIKNGKHKFDVEDGVDIYKQFDEEYRKMKKKENKERINPFSLSKWNRFKIKKKLTIKERLKKLNLIN